MKSLTTQSLVLDRARLCYCMAGRSYHFHPKFGKLSLVVSMVQQGSPQFDQWSSFTKLPGFGHIVTAESSRGLQSTDPGSDGNVTLVTSESGLESCNQLNKSIVATRHFCVVHFPWTEVHGYCPLSLWRQNPPIHCS